MRDSVGRRESGIWNRLEDRAQWREKDTAEKKIKKPLRIHPERLCIDDNWVYSTINLSDTGFSAPVTIITYKPCVKPLVLTEILFVPCTRLTVRALIRLPLLLLMLTVAVVALLLLICSLAGCPALTGLGLIAAAAIAGAAGIIGLTGAAIVTMILAFAVGG